jgi:hypothetical protein
MQSSEEIRRVMSRWLTADSTGDVEGTRLDARHLESRDVELKGLDGSHRIYAMDLASDHHQTKGDDGYEGGRTVP